MWWAKQMDSNVEPLTDEEKAKLRQANFERKQAENLDKALEMLKKVDPRCVYVHTNER
jgi:alpha-L-fucosidase